MPFELAYLNVEEVMQLDLQYENVLIASGLVHGVSDFPALKPLLRELEEGERLCRPGEPADCLWIVVTGSLAIRTDEGETIAVRSAGDVVGEQALIDDVGRRRANVIASHGSAEVLEITKTAIDSHPQSARIWRNCAWILCKKLDEATAFFQDERRKRSRARRLLRLYVGEHALSEGKLAPTSALHQPRHETAVIWFSDVVGFSRLASMMPPTQAAAFVQQFLTPQVESIVGRRGYIDKFIGDAVMGYWIVSSPDGTLECESALAAAFESVKVLSAISLGSDPLSVRIGLHIGPCVVGNFGTPARSQFTLIGQEVNKASRLESARDADVTEGEPLGNIRTSEEFFQALSNDSREHLVSRSVVAAKNIGEVAVYSIRREG